MNVSKPAKRIAHHHDGLFDIASQEPQDKFAGSVLLSKKTQADHSPAPQQAKCYLTAMIRKATRADRERISEIRFSVRENRPSKPAVIEQLVDWIFENSAFWVWEEDGAVQGFSAADPRDGSICALFVDPSYERRGIGRALLPLACDALRESGHGTAWLSTEAGTRAESFYRADGWGEIGRQEDGQIIFQKNLLGPLPPGT
jgi:GNAT superfamily N-acetyltransferase